MTAWIPPTVPARSIGGVGLVFILGMGVILLGVVLMLVMARIRPEFFKGKVLSRGH